MFRVKAVDIVYDHICAEHVVKLLWSKRWNSGPLALEYMRSGTSGATN